MPDKIRVAVVGAGRWSRDAHLPGFARSPLADLRMICDLDRELAEERQRQFDIAEVCTDYHDLLARTDIDLIDVCTRDEHEDLVFDVLGAGKHCLVEKPVAHRAEDVYRAQALAESRGLKTKVGLTFRYAPAVQYMYEMILDGFVGRPLVFNGYEQNSQWLDPDNPADKRIHKVPPKDDAVGGRVPGSENIAVHSLEGYGAPIIDISMLTTQSEVTEVVGRLKNLVPMRRRTNLDEGREAINMDDGDIYICEFANGAFGSVQSSYVTVGNYPGIEARIYG